MDLRSNAPSGRALAIRKYLADARPRTAWSELAGGDAPESWSDPLEAIEAVRLLNALGAPRRSRQLALVRYRRDPRSAWLRYGWALELLATRGPFFGWRFLAKEPEAYDDPFLTARFANLRVQSLIELSDFDRAERWIERIEQLGVWGTAEIRAQWLRAQDRRAEALELATSALKSEPRSLWLVDACLDLHQELGQADASFRLLEEKEAELDAGGLSLRLGHELLLREEPAGVEAAVARAEERLPLAEPEVQKGFAWLRGEAAYLEGRTADAIRFARESEAKVAVALADLLEKEPASSGRRKRLAVPHVAQHRSTCVPATLTSLLSFAGVDVDHVGVADAICYDGTAQHVERVWAQGQGLVVREFTLDWDTAVRLIDAGLAMSLVLTGATRGHMVAVVGYDERRRSLLLMDPSSGPLEAVSQSLFESMRPYGPRAALVLPKARAPDADAVDLPDASLYDALHAVHVAIERDDLESARKEQDALVASTPNHRLTEFARRAVAIHEKDWAAAAGACERLLAVFDNDARSRVLLVQCRLARLGREERVAALREAIDKGGHDASVFRVMLATELANDARDALEAERLALRALRERGPDGRAIMVLGRVAAHRGDAADSAELHQLGACIDWASEDAARLLHDATVRNGRGDAALSVLRARARRARTRSCLPTCTYIEALDERGHTGASLAELDDSLRARPSDRALLAFGVQRYASAGRDRRAAACMDRLAEVAVGRSLDDARIARLLRSGRIEEARDTVARRSLAEPDDVEMLARCASITGQVENRAAATAFLRRALEREPDNAALAQLVIESGVAPRERVDIAERALRREPGHVPLILNAAFGYAALGDTDASKERAERALRVGPGHPMPLGAVGRLAARRGDREEAARLFRAALENDVDQAEVIGEYVDCADEHRVYTERLAWVFERACERSSRGAGFDGWYDAARGHLAIVELRRMASAAAARRPDLATTRMLEVEALLDAQDKTEAGRRLVDADAAVEEQRAFGTQAARLWYLAGDGERALSYSHRALARFPEVQPLLFHLALLDELGRRPWAVRRARAALVRHPCEPLLLLHVARIEAGMGRRDVAVGLCESAIAIAPQHRAAWLLRAELGVARGEADVLDRVHQWTESRAWDATAQLTLSRLASMHDVHDVAIDAAKKATSLAPWDVSTHEAHALALFEGKRTQDALKACNVQRLSGRSAARLATRRALIFANTDDGRAAFAETTKILERWPSCVAAMRLRIHLRGPDDPTQAEELLAYESFDDMALMALGEEDVRRRRFERARSWYLRVLERDPKHRDAIVGAVQASKNLDDLDTAHRFIERLDAIDPGEAAAFRISFALEQGRIEAALEVLTTIVAGDRYDPDVFKTAIDTWHNNEGPPVLVAHLDELAASPDSAEAFVQRWSEVRMELAAHATAPDYVAAIASRDEDRGATAFAATANGLATAANASILWLAVRFRALLRARTRAAVAVSSAYAIRGHLWCAVAWSTRWVRRPDVAPWMLLHVASCWDALGCHDRAAATRRKARSLAPDRTTPDHTVWLALHEGCRGARGEAERLLTEADAPVTDGGKLALRLTQILLETAGPGGPSVAASLEQMSTIARSLVERGELTRSLHLTIQRTGRALRRIRTRPWPPLVRLEEGWYWLRAGNLRRVVSTLLIIGVVFGSLVAWGLLAEVDSKPRRH
ncbi:MAG: hypothetical protein HOW73_07215 [Polyangiaceae bacterium]|nr:hypothetical protein [Polyangiaceae bacterium]